MFGIIIKSKEEVTTLSALKEENDKWSQSKYEKVSTDQIYKNIPISFIHVFIQMSADHKKSFQE